MQAPARLQDIINYFKFKLCVFRSQAENKISATSGMTDRARKGDLKWKLQISNNQPYIYDRLKC